MNEGVRILAAIILVAVVVSPTAAQTEDGLTVRGQVMFLGGASTAEDEQHRFGGIEAGFMVGRFGLMAIGQRGEGNGYRSTLLAGGPAIVVLDPEFASLTAYGGIGVYREDHPTRLERSARIGYGALSLRIPIWFFALGVTGAYWQGEVEGEAVENPFRIESYRLSFGLGF